MVSMVTGVGGQGLFVVCCHMHALTSTVTVTVAVSVRGPGFVPESVATTVRMMVWYLDSWSIGSQVMTPVTLLIENLSCR